MTTTTNYPSDLPQFKDFILTNPTIIPDTIYTRLGNGQIIARKIKSHKTLIFTGELFTNSDTTVKKFFGFVDHDIDGAKTSFNTSLTYKGITKTMECKFTNYPTMTEHISGLGYFYIKFSIECFDKFNLTRIEYQSL